MLKKLIIVSFIIIVSITLISLFMVDLFAATETYELQAETEATWDDASVDSNHDGYTGSGFVNTANSSGRWIEWKIEISANTNATVKFTYACANGARPMDLSVNNNIVEKLDFPASGSWDTWITEETKFNLKAGTNIIRLTSTSVGGAPNIDKMNITTDGNDTITTEPTTPTATTTATVATPEDNTTTIKESQKTRVIVTTDGEIDDQCSMVRFLLYSNDFDVEAIVKTSSQYHSQSNSWAGDYWEKPIYDAYGTLYPNLIKHDPDYPTLAYLNSITKLGNVSKEGEMTLETEGSQLIVDVLMDETDKRPIWLQAWGGTNSIARALKTIEEKHPEKMASVAEKCRFYFIWEQDETFQSYIQEHWSKPYNIPTIISDQFITFGYWWQRWNMPKEPDSYLRSTWMKENIFKNMDNNPLIAYYNENTKEKLGGKEDFIGEGDSPSFIHEIPTGLRSTEFPNWGGWGGRYVLVRDNTWLDKVPIDDYKYPSGRWYTSTGWGRQNYDSADQELLEEYFNPITRWVDVIQNDFAARVDWCVESYEDANHQPVVKLVHALDFNAKPGSTVSLSAKGTIDPDGDKLNYKWWQYEEADTYDGKIQIQNTEQMDASFVVPNNAKKGETIHVVCEVTDNGTPPLTRYQRVVIKIN